MTVQVKGDNLIITVPFKAKELKESKSKKNLLVASTGGFKETEAQVNGKAVFLNVNAYIQKD